MTEPRASPGSPRTIQIPEDLARDLAERIRRSSFGSVDAFVTIVLARLLEQPRDQGFSEEGERALAGAGLPRAISRGGYHRPPFSRRVPTASPSHNPRR